MTRTIGLTAALTLRELRRTPRQPARVVGAIGAPVLVLVLLSSGFARSALGDQFGPSFVPGVALLTGMFASIFSAISLIEDRDSGVLRAVLATEVPSAAVALSKVLGAALPAMAQAVTVLLGGWLAFGSLPGLASCVFAAVTLALACTAVASISLGLAWRCRSVAGFHSVMNLVLMPGWLLSGSVFKPPDAARWLELVMKLNPLRVPVEMLQALGLDSADTGFIGVRTSEWMALAAITLVSVLFACVVIGRGRSRL